jgi:hypothetical protein
MSSGRCRCACSAIGIGLGRGEEAPQSLQRIPERRISTADKVADGAGRSLHTARVSQRRCSGSSRRKHGGAGPKGAREGWCWASSRTGWRHRNQQPRRRHTILRLNPPRRL